MEDGLLLDVKTDDSGRLIGRQGQTLSDLQYITNRILFQQDQQVPKVLIDVGGYRAKAREVDAFLAAVTGTGPDAGPSRAEVYQDWLLRRLEEGGYRAQARDALVKKAMEAAEKVRRWGDVVELEPLSAFDRRIIHQALKDDPSIETHSVEVEGTDKKAILLRPKH